LLNHMIETCAIILLLLCVQLFPGFTLDDNELIS